MDGARQFAIVVSARKLSAMSSSFIKWIKHCRARNQSAQLVTPTDHHAPVSASVELASSLLGLKEFDFFRLAYRRWFRSQPHPEILEKAFSDYMFSEHVPMWVNHQVREVLNQHAQGTLNPQYFGAAAYRDRYARHPQGPLYAGIVLAVSVVFFSIIVETSREHAELQRASAHQQSANCSSVASLPGVAMWANMLGGRRSDCVSVQER